MIKAQKEKWSHVFSILHTLLYDQNTKSYICKIIEMGQKWEIFFKTFLGDQHKQNVA